MRGVALCLVLTACNPLFGLDETVLLDAASVADDQDGDGVLDSVDNCPAVANSFQEDLDNDRVGNACDPCSFEYTADADRDMDGVMADSDTCPGTSDPDQLDADADGIGDVCDPNPGSADTRRCFTDFGTNVTTAWPIMDPWKWLTTSGAAYILHQPSSATPFWIGARSSGLLPSQLAVQVAIPAAPAPPATPVMLASGVAVGAADQTAYAACELVAVMTDTSARLQVSDSTGALDETALPFTTKVLTLAYRTTASGVELTCIAHGATGERQVLTRTTTATFDPSVIYLTATNATAAFEALAIYETL